MNLLRMREEVERKNKLAEVKDPFSRLFVLPHPDLHIYLDTYITHIHLNTLRWQVELNNHSTVTWIMNNVNLSLKYVVFLTLFIPCLGHSIVPVAANQPQPHKLQTTNYL